MTYYKKNDGEKILKWDGTNAVKTKMLVDPETNASLGIQIKSFPMTEEDIIKGEWEVIEADEYITIRNGKMADYWNATAS